MRCKDEHVNTLKSVENGIKSLSYLFIFNLGICDVFKNLMGNGFLKNYDGFLNSTYIRVSLEWL